MASDVICIFQGDTETLQVTLVDDCDKAVNLTGATVFLTLGQGCVGTAALTKTVTEALTASGQITDPLAGVVQFILSAADTAALAVGEYDLIEIRYQDSGGQVHTADDVVLEGTQGQCVVLRVKTPLFVVP